MLVNLEGAKVINHHGHQKLVLDLENQFDKESIQSLNVQELFAKQQNPSFLAVEEEDLQNLFSTAGYAKDKKAELWTKIIADQTSGKWPKNQAGIFTEWMSPTFETPGDEMKSGRTKYIHSVGVTGMVKFVKKGDHDYTGIFEGAEHGIIRLSSAAEPSSSKPLAPGMGLKFLRDGQDSANLVSMFDVAGQPGDWNFFSNDFVTHIPPATGVKLNILGAKFASFTNFIQEVGLSDFARYRQNGDMLVNPKFPFSLRFHPHRSVRDLFPTELEGENYTGYVDQLKTVEGDSTLYKVYAMDQPAELGGKETYIGDLVLDGALHSSKWGDEKLFFRHQNMKDDLKIQPTWEKYTEKFYKPWFQNLSAKCPFGL
jgi:hypothetical protein